MAESPPAGRHAHLLCNEDGGPTPDRPWIFRTYAGHTSARASNQLFHSNLSHGQTGLSIAFDLPTQCGYSSDHPLARPEIGKVGVPINTIDDLHVLFDGLDLAGTNTSMTINGTAMWLLALYLALARERGTDERRLRGTTQNDIIKEYLARGTYIFPPEASMRLTAEVYEYCLERVPQWNPSNICSYHLQEAGATPVQELAFSLVTAVGLLDLLRERGRLDAGQFARCVGRISFFVNAGVRFVEEMCKMRAFVLLWDEIARDRYGVEDPELRRFRYGVQVNSLNLTEAQPENNAWRIAIEALGVLLSRGARCRALQLPCWNEALSLPRPWDQQWALRLQQIMAYETDLLEYPDLFDGSPVVAAKVEHLAREARAEMSKVLATGGVRQAVEGGYLKGELVRSMAMRVARIAEGEQVVIGVNRWTSAQPSPLVAGSDGGMLHLDPADAEQALASLEAARQRRDPARAARALERLCGAAASGENLVEPSIECALARVTTGEWADALRRVFGEYRAATGVEGQTLRVEGGRLESVRERVRRFADTTGRRPRLVVGKPGLDGHSNGAEVIAVSARDAGFDVIYAGIRLTPAEIAASAIEEGADLLGLSILSGSHLELVGEVMEHLERAEAHRDIPVVVGGIVPPGDAEVLIERGVRRVFTPADYEVVAVIERMMDVIEGREAREAG
jgi:(2R)-ethylmalonyl-CoA mutase